MKTKVVQTRRSVMAAVFLTLFASQLLPAQSLPSFAGVWKLSSERSQPSREADITLKIDHHDPELFVATTILRQSGTPRKALQKYTTDGKPSKTIGADGDEFVTSVVWRGGDLVFTVEEHEDNRTIRSEETWSLIDGGTALQRVREHTDGSAKQTLIYLRQSTEGKPPNS